MGIKIVNFQPWLTKNRMLLWGIIFLPLLLAILIFNRSLLSLPSHLLNDPALSFQYKVANTATLIILARIAAIAVGLVVILICLFFPLFRIGREGVQWTKELEEELVKVSGEIAGEEIDNLIQNESFRWTLIHNWVKMKEPEPQDAHLLLRELLATLWDGFPDCKISVCRTNSKNCWGITHPLLTRLFLDDTIAALEKEQTYGIQMQVAGEEYLLLRMYTSFPEGFSPIDEKFMLVLGDIYLQKISNAGATPEQLLAHFDQIPLTAKTVESFDTREVI